jgi:pimeloyl-ACP methyl ester carboxylesterase
MNSTNRITLNGVSLELQHIPGAPTLAPLVFLHEGLGSVAMWRDWPAALCRATGRAAWLYSRAGYGQSNRVADVRDTGRLPSDYLHRQAWEVLPQLLQEIGVASPVLVGHSDGASIALLYASRHPTSACLALAAHVFVEAISLQAIRAARDDWSNGQLRAALARYHADPDGAFWQWNDAWLSAEFASFDIREDCARIQCPLLVVQGVNDNYASLQQVHEIAERVPHAATLILAACGHSTHKDQEAVLTPVLAGFLSGCGDRQARVVAI